MVVFWSFGFLYGGAIGSLRCHNFRSIFFEPLQTNNNKVCPFFQNVRGQTTRLENREMCHRLLGFALVPGRSFYVPVDDVYGPSSFWIWRSREGPDKTSCSYCGRLKFQQKYAARSSHKVVLVSGWALSLASALESQLPSHERKQKLLG